MATPIAVPLVNGYRFSFASITLRVKDTKIVGFKSIEYDRERSREKVRGNHPDPIGKTRGENEYNASLELYRAEFDLIRAQLGPGYGDVVFDVFVAYGETGFDTVTDEILGCTLDTSSGGGSQGPDALTVTCDLNPLKIRFGGEDDVEFPLVPQADQ